MNLSKATLLFTAFIVFAQMSIAQRGILGSATVSGANTIVNTYTYLTADAAVGATQITTFNNTMVGGAFGGNLNQGDLILIVQMQGATINNDPAFLSGSSPSYTGGYSVPNGFTWNGNWFDHAEMWGSIGNDFGANGWGSYNNSGKFEFVEVQGRDAGGSIIYLTCPLKNNYTAAGHVQIVRVPRYANLTVSGGLARIVPPLWNGQTGGVVAVEVNQNLNILAGSSISASGYGFRGGLVDNTGKTGSTSAGTLQNITFLGTPLPAEGSEKGEGIAGYTTEYLAIGSRFGISAPANGGGGAGYQNCGGGGGANIYTGALPYRGTGVPDQGPGSAYAGAWNLDISLPPFPNPDIASPPTPHLNFLPIGNNSSPGGGRGGYSLATSDQNELVVGPRVASWGGDARKSNGGLGGHPLAYDPTRIFAGGGGGAGDQDSGEGGSGGRGGGLVFVTCYGTITGSGIIEANGSAGQNSNPTNGTTSVGNPVRGEDGAGGGGAGGSIYIQNAAAIPASINLNAIGGNGGNMALLLIAPGTSPDEASGPGGGGAGGAIAFTTGTPTQNVTAGNNGIVTTNDPTPMMANFPPNGATRGFVGVASLSAPFYDLIPNNATICAGNTTNLSVTVSGTLPAGSSVQWYTAQFGGSSFNSGLTWTTPALGSTTTYYVGVCPGTFRIPITVTVNPTPTLIITNPPAVCAPATVDLTAAAVTAGSSAGTLSYWTNAGATTPLSNPNAVAASGTYYIQLTNAGCSTVQPVTVTINPAQNPAFTMTANCFGGTATITGTPGGTFTFNPAPGDGAIVNPSTGAVTNGNVGTTYFVQYTTPGPCPASLTQSVTAATTLSYNITITPENCGAGDGQIVLTGVAGTGGPYQYSITGGAPYQLSGTFGSLTAGAFTISVLDNSGCEVTGNEVVPGTGGPNITNMAVTNPTCAGACNGSITATVSGGTPPYTYQWYDSGMTPIGTNSATITNLCAGNYSVEVTDASGAAVTFFTEDFGTGCSQNNSANGTVTVNGTWTVTDIAPADPALSNAFFISATESGMGNGNCGDGCLGTGTTNRTLHIGNEAGTPAAALFCPSGDCGAAFDASVSSSLRAVSPVINCTGQSSISLTLDYIHKGTAGSDFGSVWYFDGVTWTAIQTPLPQVNCCDPFGGPDGVCDGFFYAQGRWNQITIPLPASADNNPNVQIGIEWVNNNDNVGTDPSLAVDNLLLSTSATGCPAVANATITDPPVVTISGYTPICIGGTVTLTGSGTPNGATPWVSANPAIATVNNAGLVTGISAGTVNITYMNSSGCTAVQSVTVIPSPTISGNAPICIGATVQLTGSGTAAAVNPWVSSNPGVATVNSTGLVTGVSAGTATITYTANTGCQSSVVVTVNPTPTISGNAPICIGATVQLTGSGTPAVSNPWLSSNPGVATVNSTGLVTGVSAGSATITFTANTGCQNTVSVTVNPTPTISGNAPICVGATVQLTGSGVPAASNAWTSSNPAVATVNSTGLVTGVSAGTSTITYVDNAGCQNTVLVTVNANPTISGNAPVCVGNTLQLTGSGTPAAVNPWVSANPAIATVSNTGLVTGVSGGSVDITYTNNAGCQSTISVIVAPNPVISTTQTPPTGCGTNDGIITVNDGLGLTGTVFWTGTASGSAVGVTLPYNISGLAPGTYDVTFTMAGTGCTSNISSQIIVAPGSPTISGNAPVCVGATVQLTGSGTPAAVNPWVSSNPAVATVSNTGLVTGVSAGTATITYTDNGACQNSVVVTVLANPTISGNAPICIGATVQLTGSGTPAAVNPWVSSNPAVATVSNTGLVTGVAAGTATITYTNSAGCQATQLVTVTANPTISGNAPICIGATVQLTGSGTPAAVNPWVSSNPAVATVSNTGLVTGVSAGTATITYTNSAGCQTTQVVTVNANPTISGNAPICVGATVQLTGSGTPAAVNPWVSSNPAVATVSGTGLVTGVSAGTATITYTNNAGCQATQVVTVNANPTISGNAPICIGATVQLTGSGTPAAVNPWVSSNPAVATVSSTGLVTGVSAGTATITYTNNAGCQATQVVTVNANPTISGNAPICIGATVQLTGSGTPAAVNPWVSSNPAVATVSSTGLVTGVSAGTATITYTNNAGCQATQVVTVNGNPTISGNAPICIGATVQLTGSGTPAAVNPWVSSNPAVATVSNTGLVTGVSAGTATITYTNSAGCQTSVVVTVNPSPTISGNAPICLGGTSQLTGSGTPAAVNPWVSSNPAVATVSNTGLVTSVSAGTTTITYTNSGGCSASVVVTVNPLPVISTSQTPLSGCNANDGIITVSDAGGATGTVSWSGSASGSAPGVTLPYNITGLAAGTYNVTFTDGTTGCTSAASQEIFTNPGAPDVFDLADQTACDAYILPTITGNGLTGNEAYYTGTGGTGTQLLAGATITSTTTLYIYDANGVCGDEESVLITIVPTPVIDPMTDVVTCGSYTLTAITGFNLNNPQYYDGAQPGGNVISGTLTTSQTVWIYDANGACSDEISFQVTISPDPQVTSISGGGSYCQGDAVGDILVDVTGTPGWTINYTLDGVAQSASGSSSPISLGNQPGVYVLVNISDANCATAANGTQTIVINPIPGAPVAGTDATYCENAVIGNMTASGSGGTMTWYNDPSLTNAIGVGSTLQPTASVGTAIYYVTETLNGCTGPASTVTITIENCDIIVPTAFTPDGDLVNDAWEILYLDENYPDNIVTVYNRWGNLVYEHKASAANPYSMHMWDGTYSGSQLPVASYFFIIDFNDGVSETVKGTVSILRNE